MSCASETSGNDAVEVRAYSPGRYPILVAKLPAGRLATLYHETGYDLARTKPVTEDWLRDNALGRHGFVELDPPREVSLPDLAAYVQRELLTG